MDDRWVALAYLLCHRWQDVHRRTESLVLFSLMNRVWRKKRTQRSPLNVGSLEALESSQPHSRGHWCSWCQARRHGGSLLVAYRVRVESAAGNYRYQRSNSSGLTLRGPVVRRPLACPSPFVSRGFGGALEDREFQLPGRPLRMDGEDSVDCATPQVALLSPFAHPRAPRHRLPTLCPGLLLWWCAQGRSR